MITAVITTYKRQMPIVERAIKSVLNQSYQDFEIIVVDDSPKEFSQSSGVKQMIENLLDNRICYYHDGGGKGACFARNFGLEKARGEYIGFLDDDDEWVNTKIEKMLNVFRKSDSNLALIYCQFIFVDDETGVESIPYDKFIGFSRGRIADSLIVDNYIGSTSFPILRTESLRNIGGFDIEMQSCQDYDVWFRIAKQYSVDYVEEPLVRFHIHANESIGKNLLKRLKGQERFFYKNIDYFKKNKDATYKRLSVLAPLYSANGKNIEALKLVIKICQIKPFKIYDNMILIAKTMRAGLKYERKRR